MQPPPDLGKPRLWTNGETDHSVKALPWPLPRATDIVEEAAADPEEAERLGRAAAKAGKSIIENPFAFGDARRARFDEGWRSDGRQRRAARRGAAMSADKGLWVKCRDDKCGHCWIAAYYPMELAKFAKVAMQAKFCPKCGTAELLETQL